MRIARAIRWGETQLSGLPSGAGGHEKPFEETEVQEWLRISTDLFKKHDTGRVIHVTKNEIEVKSSDSAGTRRGHEWPASQTGKEWQRSLRLVFDVWRRSRQFDACTILFGVKDGDPNHSSLGEVVCS